MKIFGYEIKKTQPRRTIFTEHESHVEIDTCDLYFVEMDNIMSKFIEVNRLFPEKFSTIDFAKLLKIFCESDNYHVEIIEKPKF